MFRSAWTTTRPNHKGTKPMKTGGVLTILAMLGASSLGCRTRHEIHSVSEVKPIHITIDVNIKVDRALEDYFADIDTANPSPEKGAQNE